MFAKDLMSPGLITVPPTLELTTTARVLRSQGVTGAPVVDEHGVVVGMITQSDLTRALAEEAEYGITDDELPADLTVDAARLADFEYDLATDDEAAFEETAHGYPRRLVRDVMTPHVLTVDAEASLEEVASKLDQHKVRRLVVTDQGRFLGMVSATDVVRAVAAGRRRARVQILPFPGTRSRRLASDVSRGTSPTRLHAVRKPA